MTVGRCVSCLLAVASAGYGLWLAVDAWTHGGLTRYCIVGVAVGLLFCAPLLLLPWWRRRWLRHAVFALVPVSVLLVAIEVVFRLTGFGARTAAVVAEDEHFGHVLLPGHGGTDRNGLRNAEVPLRADVLFVGDSQTYGFGVAQEECFPQRFASRSGRSVYNAAVGGYGPIQYRELVREHLALAPRDVVVGLYLGNDLGDAFRFAWLGCAADLRRDGVAYPGRQPLAAQSRPPNRAMRLVDGCLQNSRLLALTAVVLRDRLRGFGDYHGEPDAPRWLHGAVATRFAPAACLRPGSPAAAELAEGVRLTSLCLRGIAADCRQAGARPWLLLLHSKESCYQTWLVSRGQGLAELGGIPEAEAAVHRELAAAALEAGMEIVDPTAALIAELAADQPPWPAGSDRHPSAHGYDVIARELLRALPVAK